jgi:hypothetical protein
MRAFSTGGLQYADRVAPPPPPRGDDPIAMERWARQRASATQAAWKVRIDTEAKTPCPT